MDYWTLSGGVACRNGWSCRACKQNIYKGQEILVREGRKLRFHFHKGCFQGNGDPRTQNESTYFNQQRYGKIADKAPEVKGYGKWSVGSYGYQPSFK
ncbi:unnamed protein product [Paramecium octaurelia]|uniref:Uncharacterized protein n=1 Tax=Paramecium octaurelia TaxID=43137 RepID=A0A8S1VPA8_PAROT|nr:unnamed protein product [Paramecium octaurelia]